ncbi:MAG TPA: hypothetical protein PK733_03770 [Clostridiales bacterium]|nr:hypothetical protein [Clostridiales bacterium]
MEENMEHVDKSIALPANLDFEIEKAIQMRETFNKLFNNLLQQGVDFDRIPGTDKPTLLKPGADLLCQVFHFASGEPKMLSIIEDFEKGILSYTVSIPVIHRDTGTLVAVGIGSANSFEVKYKYRYVDADGGEKVRVENPEPADQQNTLVKMAAKRAYIDGVLKATGASRMFTQDIEDMPWLQPEKASSKQLNYIRALYKDVPDDKILEDAAGIINRNIENVDDISREEASRIIEVKKSKNYPQYPLYTQEQADTKSDLKYQAKKKTEAYSCANCGVRITQGVAAYSRNKFGKLLCGNCQKSTDVFNPAQPDKDNYSGNFQRNETEHDSTLPPS